MEFDLPNLQQVCTLSCSLASIAAEQLPTIIEGIETTAVSDSPEAK
jgi:hypothetical protein